MATLFMAFGVGASFGQALSEDATAELEQNAQSFYQDDNLKEAAASYLKLAHRAADPNERGGFALLAGWILHQAELPDQRDQALLLSLKEDPSSRPDPAVFSADFLQVVQQLRLQLENSTRQRYAELSLAGERAFQRQDYKQANLHYKELVALEPNRVDLRLQLAVSQLNAGEPSAARQTLEPLEPNLERLEPELRERFLSLSTMAKIRTGDTADAGTQIRRVSGPVQRQLWLELASAFQRAKQWEQAVLAFGSVLEIDPADRETAILRSQLLMQLDRTRDAESFLVNLSETLPSSNAVWHQLGVTREDQNDQPGALAAYRHATAVAPKDDVDRAGYLQALLASARLLRRSDSQAASAMVSRALETDPNYVDALAMNVRLLGDQQRHPEAIQLARRIAALAPNRVDITNLLGNSYYRAGNYQEAIAVFEELLSQHPELEAVQENLALARRQDTAQDSATTNSEHLNSSSGPSTQKPTTTSARAINNDTASEAQPIDTSVRTNPNASKAPAPRPDPSALPVGVDLAPFHWAQTGRNVLRVVAVHASSKAERCGLQAGDLLIRVAGKAANSPAKTNQLLAGNTSGVRLDVVRDSKPMTLVCI